jgi:hypothetical protein
MSKIRVLYNKPEFRRAMRAFIASNHNPANRHWVSQRVDENANIRAHLDQLVPVEGKVGVIESGMDCDCSAYHREYLMPMFTSVAQYKRWAENEYAGAEGPHNMHLVNPDQIDRSRNGSRDLALEAFEGGHSHVVYL